MNGDPIDLTGQQAAQLPTGLFVPTRVAVEYMPAIIQPAEVETVVDVEAIDIEPERDEPIVPVQEPGMVFQVLAGIGGAVAATARWLAGAISGEVLIIGAVAALAFATSVDNLLTLGEHVGVHSWHAWVVAGSQEILASYAFFQLQRLRGLIKLIPLLIFAQAAAFLVLANLASPGRDGVYKALPWEAFYLAMPPVVCLELVLLWELSKAAERALLREPRKGSRVSQTGKVNPQRKRWFRGSPQDPVVSQPGGSRKAVTAAHVKPAGGSPAAHPTARREPSAIGSGGSPTRAVTAQAEPRGKAHREPSNGSRAAHRTPRKKSSETRQDAVARWINETNENGSSRWTSEQIIAAGLAHYGAARATVKRDMQTARSAS